MKRLKAYAASAAILAAAGCMCFRSEEPAPAYPDAVDEGFVPLIQGPNLTGWARGSGT